jgi:hypothetical protein
MQMTTAAFQLANGVATSPNPYSPSILNTSYFLLFFSYAAFWEVIVNLISIKLHPFSIDSSLMQ